MAQLVTANPKLFSKSPDQELSESVVKVSGNSKFTRLDVREQCVAVFNQFLVHRCIIYLLTIVGIFI